MEIFFVWLVFAVLAAVVAGSKGRSAFGWLLLGCVFGIFALIAVALMPKLAPAGTQGAAPSMYRKCPDCAEEVLREAKVCKHCGCSLTPEPTLAKPQKRCATCGTMNDTDKRLCAGCGAML